MKREDLFLAIGAVEEERLYRSELSVSSGNQQEGNRMGKFETKRNGRRIIRNLLIAAVIVSMLSVTAYAVGGYLIFNSPEEMLAAIFGDETGYDHKDITTWTDPWKPGNVYESPAYDRVPADETVVTEDVAPHVSAVGQSISWKGWTLTIDANLYDSNTRCGVLTYRVENPDGIKEYKLQADGEIWYPGGQPIYMNQSYNEFIIQEMSSDTVLTIACYYQVDEGEDLEVTFSHWAVIDGAQELMAITNSLLEEARQSVSPEDAIAAAREKYGDEAYAQAIAGATQEDIELSAYYDIMGERFDALYACPDTITIHCDETSTLDSVTAGDGAITVTPIGIQIDLSDMEAFHQGVSSVYTDNIDSVTIRYGDGSEYPVASETVMNYVYNLSENTGSNGYHLMTYIFNRIIDVDQVAAVIINDTEFPVT